jgi:hypothetical protein
MMTEIERLRTVAANYEAMQGLKLVPMALPVAYAGIGALADGMGGWGALVGFVLTTAVAFALAHAAGRWYQQRYGVVRPTRAQRREMAVRCGGAIVLVLGAALLDAWLDLRVALFGIAAATAFAAYWRTYTGLTRQHVVAAASIAAASFLGLFLDRDTAWGILFLTLAVAYAVVGLLDHKTLASTLAPAPDAA